jgi:hypothetical protein
MDILKEVIVDKAVFQFLSRLEAISNVNGIGWMCCLSAHIAGGYHQWA